MQTNPEQWAVELWRDANNEWFDARDAETGTAAAIAFIQAAFAEQNARNSTDAAPVAWMPIESAPTKPKRHGSSSGPSILTIGTDQVGLVTETRYLDPGPFVRTDRGSYHKPAGWYWAGWDGAVGPVNPTHWQPLPAAPDHIEEPRAMVPATDVAALVEAAKANQHYGCPVCSGDCGSANPPVMACPMQALSAALAPFTKGQNDENA